MVAEVNSTTNVPVKTKSKALKAPKAPKALKAPKANAKVLKAAKAAAVKMAAAVEEQRNSGYNDMEDNIKRLGVGRATLTIDGGFMEKCDLDVATTKEPVQRSLKAAWQWRHLPLPSTMVTMVTEMLHPTPPLLPPPLPPSTAAPSWPPPLAQVCARARPRPRQPSSWKMKLKLKLSKKAFCG
jgi:hypothetical protein